MDREAVLKVVARMRDSSDFLVQRWADELERVASSAAQDGIDVHPSTRDLVARFSDAMLRKLAAAEKKYGYSDGWARPDWMEECREHLRQHIEKGDPRDVAAYCAFLWHHGESTAVPGQASQGDEAAAETVTKLPDDAMPDQGPALTDKWKQAYENEADKFQKETLRCSELAAILRRAVDVLRIDHEPGPWSRSCTRCEIVERATELLSKPINSAPPAPPDGVPDGWRPSET